MIIHVHADDRITLDDPDNFKAFSVDAGARTAPEVAPLFDGDATAIDDDHLWIATRRLHALGERFGCGDWRAGCDGMLAYAAKQGFLDEARSLVRAHLDR